MALRRLGEREDVIVYEAKIFNMYAVGLMRTIWKFLEWIVVGLNRNISKGLTQSLQLHEKSLRI